MALEWLRALEKGGSDGQHHHEHTSLTPEQIAIYITASVLLTLMAGLMSGLTLGLLSLDALDMEVLKRSGTAREKRAADLIAPVISKGHLLLVTLLMCNAFAAEVWVGVLCFVCRACVARCGFGAAGVREQACDA